MASASYRASDSLHGVCVLVVEQELNGQRLFASILRYCGAYVKAASSSKEALGHLENLRPDAVVIRLTGADTFSLVGRIRMSEPDAGGSVPILGIVRAAGPTGSGIAGCDALLAEPIDPWGLCRVIGNLVTSDG